MIDGGKVESGLYTLSAKSEMDMIKERLEKFENDLHKKEMEKASESKLSNSEILDGFNEIKTGETGRMSERKTKQSNP
jgi:archaellum component FlaC